MKDKIYYINNIFNAIALVQLQDFDKIANEVAEQLKAYIQHDWIQIMDSGYIIHHDEMTPTSLHALEDESPDVMGIIGEYIFGLEYQEFLE